MCNGNIYIRQTHSTTTTHSLSLTFNDHYAIAIRVQCYYFRIETVESVCLAVFLSITHINYLVYKLTNTPNIRLPFIIFVAAAVKMYSKRIWVRRCCSLMRKLMKSYEVNRLLSFWPPSESKYVSGDMKCAHGNVSKWNRGMLVETQSALYRILSLLFKRWFNQ